MKIFIVSLLGFYLGINLETAISSTPNYLAQINNQTLPPSINLNNNPQTPLITVPPLNSQNVPQPNYSTQDRGTLPNESDNMDSILIHQNIPPKLPDTPVIQFGNPLPH